MPESNDYVDLVLQAKKGDEDSLNRLAEKARRQLCVYVQRMTLNNELTQDIVQETLLEMYRFLDKLEKADRFWPWLRKIAVNKLHHHYAREGKRRMKSLSSDDFIVPSGDAKEGFAELVGQELREIIIETMHKLKPRYREVLVMRCYEEMEYSDIAEEIGCTEFGTRVLFFRAKNALARQLAKRGLGKAALAGMLILFGKITAPSQAAAANITVTSASLSVGAGAAAAAIATTKTAIVTTAAVGIMAVSSSIVVSEKNNDQPAKLVSPLGPVIIEEEPGADFKPVNNCWFFYPEGSNGPVMTRRMIFSGSSINSYKQWLHNAEGDYVYDAGKSVAEISNCPFWHDDLRVRRLPTDSPELSGFLTQVQPGTIGLQQVTDSKSGLLVIAKQDYTPSGNSSWKTHYQHVLNEDYFRCDFPEGVTVIDKRDAMHKQGGAFFRISGSIKGRRISGKGRIPLYYASYDQFEPWLKIKIGRNYLIKDGADDTYIYKFDDNTLKKYPKQMFFRGLMSPWNGLHIIDGVRRDAADRKLNFQTRLSNDNRTGEVAIDYGDIRLVYVIDMECNLINEMTFYKNRSSEWEKVGEFIFEYFQDMNLTLEGVVKPKPEQSDNSKNDVGILWLMQLAEQF